MYLFYKKKINKFKETQCEEEEINDNKIEAKQSLKNRKSKLKKISEANNKINSLKNTK